MNITADTATPADRTPEQIKRRVRTLVRDGDDMREFDVLEDALDFMGIVKLGGIAPELLCETIEPGSTVVVFDARGMVDDGAESPFARQPPAHRTAVGLAGLAMMYTADSRDPVLAVNGGAVFLFVVSSAAALRAFLVRRFGGRVPALSPPPSDPRERWVISLTPTGELWVTRVGLGIRPGTAQA
jgi:hypothetical protein